jgi:hypothetical protein
MLSPLETTHLTMREEITMKCRSIIVKITATNAYEVNIFDTRPDPSYATGAIVNVAKGPQLPVVLNGTKTVEVQDSQFASGPLALQYGAGVVKFRKVEIRPL